MSSGQFSLDIQWPSGKLCMDGQISDKQYAAICKILSPDNRQIPDVSEMVNRFLGWKLPQDFSPDCGISFKQLNYPSSWPIGTNLFTAAQAKAMFEYVLRIDAGFEIERREGHE